MKERHYLEDNNYFFLLGGRIYLRGIILVQVCLSLYSLWHTVVSYGKDSCWTLQSLFFCFSPEMFIADTSVFLFQELCYDYSVSYKHSYNSPL